MSDQNPAPEEEQTVSPDPTEVHVPEGASQYGWVWIVGIIVVVGLVLFALERNVPSGSEEPAGGDEAPATSAVPFGPTSVTAIQAPASAEAGAIVGVDWHVVAPEAATITHTAVHWGTVSQAESVYDENRAPDTSYPNMTSEYTSGSFAIPDAFETNLTLPASGTVSFRVHAEIDGKHFWSEEKQISVKGK